MSQITPIILCGGSGTRLWPLSRKSFPKQFTRLVGENSLFQASALRLAGSTDGLSFAAPTIVTNSDFRFIVTEQLISAGITPGPILIEPSARNTAPAALAAAMHAAQQDPDAILLLAPSDHLIPDSQALHAAIRTGLPAIAEGNMILFGVSPDQPLTSYGYLELANPPGEQSAVIPLSRFVEKPDLETAKTLLSAGNFLWNAGIFLVAAKDLISAFQTHAPDLIDPVNKAVTSAEKDLDFLRLDPGAWDAARDISIDYAVMEHANNLSVVPLTTHWSDLGSWDAVQKAGVPDENRVVKTGPATAIDCENTLLRSESDDLELVGIGLKNLTVVAMPDAVLVADTSRAQDVKLAVDILKAKGARQAEAFSMDHRPWGHFETLALEDRFQVKRIVVKPGAALSLQSHVHRSEHWIVVAGTAKVTIDDQETLVTENESVYVPLGAKHRLENPGKLPMVLIEVQTGSYLGEDDIRRYEDIYARNQGAKG